MDRKETDSCDSFPGDFAQYSSSQMHFRFQADDYLNNVLGNLDVRLVEIGYTPNPVCWEILGENSDPWFRLYYMPVKSAYLRMKERTAELKPGYLHLIPPRLKFRYDLSSLAPHAWIHFFSNALQQLLPRQIFSVPFQKMETLLDILKCTETKVAGTPASIFKANLLCRNLLGNFFMSSGFQEHAKYEGIPAPLRQTAEFIRQNCDADISVEELAQIARMSPSQFARQFRKYFQDTPKEYYCNARIDHAKTLLMQTDLSTKEIAERCGFCDCYSFYHLFKKKTHLTPSQYRSFNKIVY